MSDAAYTKVTSYTCDSRNGEDETELYTRDVEHSSMGKLSIVERYGRRVPNRHLRNINR
jgi:hypothetical protein